VIDTQELGGDEIKVLAPDLGYEPLFISMKTDLAVAGRHANLVK
jgi:hypothetical protein